VTGRALMPILVGRPALIEFDAGSSPRDRTLNPLKVESDDIRRWIERRDPRPIGHWNELGEEEFARSFTAARTAGADVIDDLYFAFYDTVAAGGTTADFEKLVIPTLKAKGWLADQGAGTVANRVRLIYDTNLRLARSSGRWARYWGTRNALPYLRGVTARDERVRHPPKSPRSDHRAFDGIILPIEHEFWTRWFPPLGFRCRCSVIQMSRSQLARYPGGVTTEADLASREARLGTPIFASPAVGLGPQLESMAEKPAEDVMPGRPPVDVRNTASAGARIWADMLHLEGIAAINQLLAEIFGQAA
jgi:hypothetical protein